MTCVKSKKERFIVFCVGIPKKHWWWKTSGKITLFIQGAHFLVPIWKFSPIQLWKWSIKRMVRRRQLSVNYVKKRREVCWNVFYVQRQFITDVWLKRMNMNYWTNGWINVKNKTIFFITFASKNNLFFKIFFIINLKIKLRKFSCAQVILKIFHGVFVMLLPEMMKIIDLQFFVKFVIDLPINSAQEFHPISSKRCLSTVKAVKRKISFWKK